VHESDTRTGTAGLIRDLELQHRALSGRCPSYLRALELLPSVLEGTAGRYIEAAWSHRRFHAFYDRPLLLLAALRADARAEGPSHPLHAAFVSEPPLELGVTADALSDALGPARERVYEALTARKVQTNETSRAVAWLWPAALAGASGGRRSVALADVGASAGLNLVADALPVPWSFLDGQGVELAREIRAVARLGLDASPLDAARPEDADWLRACIWPGEPEREERLEEALAAFAAARSRPDAPVLVPILAGNVPARLDVLSSTERGALVIAYQTVFHDYLARDERAEYRAGMHGWLSAHPPGQALWVELEPSTGPGIDPPRACALVAHLRAPDGVLRTMTLARCGYHPRVLHPEWETVNELRMLLDCAGDEAAPGTP